MFAFDMPGAAAVAQPITVGNSVTSTSRTPTQAENTVIHVLFGSSAHFDLPNGTTYTAGGATIVNWASLNDRAASVGILQKGSTGGVTFNWTGAPTAASVMFVVE
jgi:hypothetical protein